MTTPPQPTNPETGQAPNGGPAAPPADPQHQSGAPATGEQDAAYWKAEAEKWQHFSRQNEDRAKANKAAIDEHSKVLKALAQQAGIDVDGKPDPDKLLADLSSRDEQLKQTRIENAVLKVASKHGADLDALLDSRTFLSELGELDPADKTFQANVDKAIKSAIEKNPRLKAATASSQPTQTQQQPPAAPSGGDFNGAPQGQRQWTADDVDRATPQELEKAMKDGLLRDYMNA